MVVLLLHLAPLTMYKQSHDSHMTFGIEVRYQVAVTQIAAILCRLIHHNVGRVALHSSQHCHRCTFKNMNKQVCEARANPGNKYTRLWLTHHA